MNKVILIGRTTKDITLKSTTSGIYVTTFDLAVRRNYTNESGEYVTDFISCVAWRKNAEFLNKYVTKGMLIAVEGNIQTRKYEDTNGNNKYVVEINVESVNLLERKQTADESATETIEKQLEQRKLNTDDDLPF